MLNSLSSWSEDVTNERVNSVTTTSNNCSFEDISDDSSASRQVCTHEDNVSNCPECQDICHASSWRGQWDCGNRTVSNSQMVNNDGATTAQVGTLCLCHISEITCCKRDCGPDCRCNISHCPHPSYSTTRWHSRKLCRVNLFSLLNTSAICLSCKLNSEQHIIACKIHCPIAVSVRKNYILFGSSLNKECLQPNISEAQRHWSLCSLCISYIASRISPYFGCGDNSDICRICSFKNGSDSSLSTRTKVVFTYRCFAILQIISLYTDKNISWNLCVNVWRTRHQILATEVWILCVCLVSFIILKHIARCGLCAFCVIEGDAIHLIVRCKCLTTAGCARDTILTRENLSFPFQLPNTEVIDCEKTGSLLFPDRHCSSLAHRLTSGDCDVSAQENRSEESSPFPVNHILLPQPSLHSFSTSQFQYHVSPHSLKVGVDHQSKRTHFLWSFSAILLLCHILALGLPHVTAQGLIGTITTCENEGEMVQVPGITDDPCITCTCRNKQVDCETRNCRNVAGCHAILFDQPSQRCCEMCKGCRFQGSQYESGDSWRDKKDHCKQYSCRAGVVTVSAVQCHSHCYNTVPVPGQCCPVCPGCFFRGQGVTEGETFKLSTDVCTTCRCQNGNILCEREQCPVLNCPPDVIYQPKNECCPKCKGMRRVFDVRSRCYFAKQIYKKNQQFMPNKCSSCICKFGTSVCETETCPALDCPPEERTALPGSRCCLRCMEKRVCVFDGKTYKHREEWKPNVCMQCSCEDGVTYCQREKCSNSLWCPQGYKLLLTEKECCPRCVEHDAVCSVFGDPHYRTFDGLMYSFQGTCKYILAKDCIANDFLIKVRNGVRFSSGFAWTQMLVVFVYKHRISMLQNSGVKVNRKRTRLPYIQPGMFSISRDGEFVKLKTSLGLQVTWDGDSFLEVTVSTKYKNRMCGLCGNYNGIKSDDLLGEDGTMYMSGEDYGHSWRVGSTRACKVRPKFFETQPLCERDLLAKQRAHRVCSIFYGRAFSRCRQKVSVDVYVSSCITDMCDCPEGRYCACEAIRAYTSQCTRSGATVKWDKIRNCQVFSPCPSNAIRVDCGEICPRTCEKPESEDPCPEQCLQGCHCTGGKVLHQGKCIQKKKCPHR